MNLLLCPNTCQMAGYTIEEEIEKSMLGDIEDGYLALGMYQL